MTHGNLHIAWCELLFESLVAAGVSEVVVSPGSRSTPLVIAAARTAGLSLHTVIDERAAGFFALGQARLSGRPSVLLCTSGTAPAHYLPAVIEASQAHVPMVVLSADRPWEAQACASPQTVDQTALFGHHLRHRAELGEPDPSALAAVGRIAAQCVAAACGPDPGAVQLNARFRKPLEPVEVSAPEPWRASLAALRARGAPRVFAPSMGVCDAAVSALAARCVAASRGVIACGPMGAQGGDGLRRAVMDFARATGFVVLAEATSQCRFGGDGWRVGGADAVLRDRGTRERLAPEWVIELGAPLTSGAWASYLDAHPLAPRTVISAHGWNDPRSEATEMVFGAPREVLERLTAALPAGLSSRAPSWAERWRGCDAAACAAAAEECHGDALTEGMIAATLVRALPAGAVLAVGNSMPVRDIDTYAPPGDRALTVLHQRGASGIDGLIAGACGARSLARDPVALLLGDVSFAHDLGSLSLARGARGALVIVVVQNRGGRIFGELPLRGRSELGAVFERYFTTDPEIDIGAHAAAAGVGHVRVSDRAALAQTLAVALGASGCTVVEAVVPPDDAHGRRRALWAATAAGARGVP